MLDTLVFVLTCLTFLVICMWSVRIEREATKQAHDEYKNRQ